MKHLLPVLVALIAGCSATPPPAACAPSTTETCAVAATRPDAAKTKAHLAAHVKYPAQRADILAACADTPEFTGGEKQWLADNLPQGDYAGADEVARALHL
jgi:hypothetical protein